MARQLVVMFVDAEKYKPPGLFSKEESESLILGTDIASISKGFKKVKVIVTSSAIQRRF